MRRALMIIGLIFALSVLAACGGTLMGSVGGNLPASGGSAYCLPKAVLTVKLSDINGDLVLTISEPVYVPDEASTYLLQYRPNIFYNDTVELTVDPKTNLLQTVNGTAEDKTSQTIAQLAKSAAIITTLGPPEEGRVAPEEGIVIFERRVDPADDDAVKKLVKDMNTVATGHAETMCKRLKCTCKSSEKTENETESIDTKNKMKIETKPDSKEDDRCESYKALQQEKNPISFVIQKPALLKAEPADCSLGVCYRIPAPYGIEFTFNNQYSYGTVVNLPNARPAILLPLNRTAFVKSVDNAEFENGMLKKTHYEKPSEALEVTSLPVTVATGIFSSISTLVQAKIDISDKEKGLAQSQAALLQAQKDLQDKRMEVAEKAAEKQKSGVLLSGRSSGRRFSTR